jgi:hypothetical protein
MKKRIQKKELSKLGYVCKTVLLTSNPISGAARKEKVFFALSSSIRGNITRENEVLGIKMPKVK